MRTSKPDNEPCGVRLVRLIHTQSLEIAKREVKNEDKMCLYGTGEYWIGFEHSAYFLSRIFPDLESFVVNNPESPFAIVGLSVTDKKLKQYMKKQNAHRRGTDYLEFAVSPFLPKEYGAWHTKKVGNFKEAFSEYSHRSKHIS